MDNHNKLVALSHSAVLLSAILCPITPSIAAQAPALAEKPTAVTETKIPSSGGDIKRGDSIEFPVETPIFYTETYDAASMMKMRKGPFCAAAHHDFTVDDITPASNGQSAELTVHFNNGFWNNLLGDERTGYKCTTALNNGFSAVERRQSYVVSSSDLPGSGPERFGLAWGALIIPYKYEFKDGSFSGTPSTVAFVGPQFSIYDSNIILAFFAGPGVSNGSQSDGNKALFSFGSGLVATLGGVFKVGLMAGWDYAGKNSGFKYEATPWAALSIGAGF
jgi:hypothetical protein